MQETSKEKGESANARRTQKKSLQKRVPHMIELQIPEYHTIDADADRSSKAQNQRCTKAA